MQTFEPKTIFLPEFIRQQDMWDGNGRVNGCLGVNESFSKLLKKVVWDVND